MRLGVRWQGWLFGMVLVGVAVRGVPALSHNLHAIQLLHTNLQPYTTWYNNLPPNPCHNLACNQDPLDKLWQARSAWQAGNREQACNLWWSLNANNDLWIVAQQPAQTADQWTEVAQALSCLDRWENAQPEQPLINGIYGGWIAEKYGELATLYQTEQQFSRALIAYQQAVKWDPQPNASHILGAANIWLTMGQQPEANQWILNQTATITDANIQYILLINWAESLLSNGYETEGISTLALTIQTVPDHNPYPYFRLARLYLEQDQPTLALPILQQARQSPLAQQTTTHQEIVLLLTEVYQALKNQ